MSDHRPPEPASSLLPPASFVDEQGRSIEVRRYDGDEEALLGLYEGIDPGDRAQGLPPVTVAATRNWLADITAVGSHLVAWHDGRAVGHACLLPAGEVGHELAVFVRSEYQHARIGTRLLRTLLGTGAKEGIERVWLTVRRDNVVARSLYESAGFTETDPGTDASPSDVEMARALW